MRGGIHIKNPSGPWDELNLPENYKELNEYYFADICRRALHAEQLLDLATSLIKPDTDASTEVLRAIREHLSAADDTSFYRVWDRGDGDVREVPT